MTILPTTLAWCPSNHVPPEAWSTEEKTWLSYAGSLTMQLRRATNGALEHRVLFRNWGQATAEESELLHHSLNDPAWIREIEWICHGKLAVVARVVIPQKSLAGKGKKLQAIGNRSLGDILFSDPHLQRTTLEISALQPGHPYYELATKSLIKKPTFVWARRSLFYFHGKPIFICEIFLSPLFHLELQEKQAFFRTRLRQYFHLMRFDRPIGILLLLWPTLWALWIAAKGVPTFSIVVIFIAGVVLMRAAGCIMNDLADRKIDTYVKRTKNRPLATGRVSEKEALILCTILCSIAFILVLFLNPLTILLSGIAIVLAMVYPFLKRYTHLPQLVLGIAFSWSIPMAFAAQTHTVPLKAGLLLLASVLWTMVYDTEYALVDREDDLNIGVKSTAILFGRFDRLAIGLLQIAMLVTLLCSGIVFTLHDWFYTTLIPTALLMGHQQYLLRHRQPQACLRAFSNNHWIGLLIFAGIVVGTYPF